MSDADRARYAAFGQLQSAANAFNFSVPIPEFVAVGGQSDGKSSLLEALLGFKFNVREVEMGTR
jgi:ABC-type transport system involved in cytochrome bd biosynthesis fused ATPase/permease subunit